MSSVLDETAADVPVKDITVTLSRLTAAAQDSSVYQHARARQDISRVSREELEDRFLRLNEETILLKQHINKQDDKIKKLGTKLMRLVKDRGRMEQLAAGGAQPLSRVRDVEMEEMVEELQDKVRRLQTENEGLKQRLLLAKQQLVNSQSHRPTPYGHVQSRVNSGLKRLRDDASSPSQARPKSTRSLEGGGRPLTGQLPRYGHSLLEEARAEIRNLENVIESQRSQKEEQEGISELLREELRKKEAEYEEKLLQVRQQQTSKLRSHVSSNVTMIKLQKQLEDRSNAVAELEGRFLQLQESQQALKASHEAAMAKVDELSAHLKDERLKSLDLEKQLQSSSISRLRMEQLQERIGELEQERDLLKDNNDKLVNSAFDVSQQQKWQIQEQQLRLQISQLETALKADLVDKNEILDKIKAERDTNEKLTEENKKLQIQFLEQKQQLEELNGRMKFYNREGDYDVAELTEALMLIKTRKSQKNGDLGFLKEVEEEANSTKSSIRELRASHAETIQELEKTRSLLNVENRISKDYKAELDAAVRKKESDKVEYEQKLERQAQLLDTRAAKIRKLEAQLREIAYGTKTYVFKPDVTGEDEAGEFNETLHLERGENLLELQIVSAALSPSALQVLDDTEPSTFCTYSFYLFDLHSTPVATGRQPRYGFTSRYVVNMDDGFLHYLHRYSVMVELHQALGLDWRTLASGQLRLQQLLEQDGKIHGSIPLVVSCLEKRMQIKRCRLIQQIQRLHLFGLQTGNPEDTAARATASEKDGDIKRVSTKEWARSTGYDSVKLFNKLFKDDIMYLLTMDKLWKKRKAPIPLDWQQLENSMRPQEESPASGLKDQQVLGVWGYCQLFQHSVETLRLQLQEKGEGSELVWDKDDPPAMDFVTAAANLRMHIFSMNMKSRFDVKSMAGNIIPAIATTNAVIAGLIVLEGLKILSGELESCRTIFLNKCPNLRKKLLVPCILDPPSANCYVCASKPEVTVKLNVQKTTVLSLQDRILKERFGMVAPDVQIEDGKGTILISSEEGETEANNNKFLGDFGIRNGSRLQADDFLQDYTLLINVLHTEELERDVEFEVVGEAPDKAPPPQNNQEEVNSITNGNKDSAQPSTSSKAPAEDDDIMIVDSDEEEAAASSSVAATSGTKRKHPDAETGETSTKRPRTDQSAAAPTDDDDDIIALD